jgi:hypothetical protein
MKVRIHEIIRKVITYLWLILRNHLKGMSKKHNSFIGMNLMLKLKVLMILVPLWFKINHQKLMGTMKMVLNEKI